MITLGERFAGSRDQDFDPTAEIVRIFHPFYRSTKPMRGASPHLSLWCRLGIFRAVQTGAAILALCGTLVVFCGLPGKLSAQSSAPMDRNLTPEPNAPSNLPLELRGILLDERGSFFGFYNVKNGRSTWVALGKPMDGFVVRSHDEGSDWITAEYEGHIFTMALKTSPLGESGLTAFPAPPVARAKESEAIRSEILNRKVLRLRAQKSRLQKALKNNATVSP